MPDSLDMDDHYPRPWEVEIAELKEENRRLTHRTGCQTMALRRLEAQYRDEIGLRATTELHLKSARRDLDQLRRAAVPFARLAHWLIGVVPRYGLGRVTIKTRRWLCGNDLAELARLVPQETVQQEPGK